ncbi:AmmeMemoRadiSam system protein A [Sansalvadorimonas verongulae]|uniref:AmmeMemoRadiSam system protein A n=1 Tax=Sansalvadorimonas verongulae TaxID=2172824 RepID=UPI0012BB6AE6|nr:AmmeMemoRadiSam system protein A [Sansalvadorimonas verongulae]MTI12892.1 AmmeMemoRadiSam system protein A [Sansalvadorimonas verongulae]
MYSDNEKQQILALTKSAIQMAVQGRTEQQILCQFSQEPFYLTEVRACFISLHKGSQLRGCIGSLDAYRPLKEDIVHNAVSAALYDRRFPPLTEAEFDSITVEVSILSPVMPMHVRDEADLLNQLQPYIDGLIIDDGKGHRATFLPQVWKQLPDKKEFLSHLKKKAGLENSEWPKSLQCLRYHCEVFQ